MASAPAAAPKRFLVVDCEDSAKWAGHAACHIAAFGAGDGREEWVVSRAYLWPVQEPPPDAAQFAGVVVTGSRHSAVEGSAARPEWVDALVAWLREAVALGSVQVLGGCFGCQALACALGGRVSRSDRPFVIGVETLEPTAALRARPDYARARRLFPHGGAGDRAEAPIHVLQSHGDFVQDLPPAATLLADSGSCGVEVWAQGDNVLAWQGHPEFTVPLLERKILCTVVRSGTVPVAQARAARAAMAATALDHAVLLALGRRFLRRGDPAFEDGAEAVAAARARCDVAMGEITAPSDEELYGL